MTADPGRHLCTKEDPYIKGEHLRGLHPDAEIIGDVADGGGDRFKCPNCDVTWTNYYDLN